jgi:hypothetical protein
MNNTLYSIANESRLLYYQRLLEEYHKQKDILTHKSKGNITFDNKIKLEPDCESEADYKKYIRLEDISDHVSNHNTKLYREDIVVFQNNQKTKSILCYPVHVYEDDFVEEEIPIFKTFKGKIKLTEIEINPFPWFCTKITFYPSAETIKGILDFWFYKWFFSISKPNPFLNVVHRLDGPQLELYGGESYYIDLGTAPAESFLELIYEVCRDGVDKIEIS